MRRSTLYLDSATALGKEENKKLMQVVQALLDDPEAVAFSEPVDWQTLGLLDYPSIVKAPMDLGTIKRNLLSNRYQFVEECLDDLQLVWDCCRLYNQSGTWIMNIAVRLEKQLRRLVRNYLPAFNLGARKKKSDEPRVEEKPLPDPKDKKDKPKKAEPPPKPVVQVSRQERFVEQVHLLTQDQLAILTQLLIKKGRRPEWRENRLSFTVESIGEELMGTVLEQMDLWGVGRLTKKCR